MITQFTPGPWEACQADRDYPIRIRNQDDWVLATADDGGHVDPAFALPEKTILANARMMAAAPELYEALVLLVGRSDGHDNMNRDFARKALAKALGEQ